MKHYNNICWCAITLLEQISEWTKWNCPILFLFSCYVFFSKVQNLKLNVKYKISFTILSCQGKKMDERKLQERKAGDRLWKLWKWIKTMEIVKVNKNHGNCESEWKTDEKRKWWDGNMRPIVENEEKEQKRWKWKESYVNH